MAKTKERTRRPRQKALLEEMDPPSYPDLDEAAETYHALKTQRMEVLKAECDAKERVKTLMVEHGLCVYTTASDLECVREPDEVGVVFVKPKKHKSNGEAE